MKKIDTYKLAMEIVHWCKKNKCWRDVVIYINGKAWTSSPTWGSMYDHSAGRNIGCRLYEYDNRNPKDYFSHINEPNILSMSFEGDLYNILNGYRSDSSGLRREFQGIFDKYGLFYEHGNAWNLTAYEQEDDADIWR